MLSVRALGSFWCAGSKVLHSTDVQVVLQLVVGQLLCFCLFSVLPLHFILATTRGMAHLPLAGGVSLQLTLVAEGLLYSSFDLQELNSAYLRYKSRAGVPSFDRDYFSPAQDLHRRLLLTFPKLGQDTRILDKEPGSLQSAVCRRKLAPSPSAGDCHTAKLTANSAAGEHLLTDLDAGVLEIFVFTHPAASARKPWMSA